MRRRPPPATTTQFDEVPMLRLYSATRGTMSSQQPHPSPALLFETISAHQRSAALKASVELDLFTAVAEGHSTAAAIARRTQAAERGVRILCDFLVISGLLTKEGSAYRLTP